MTPTYGDRLVTAPTWEPVTLAQAKSQCRVRPGFTGDDAMFDGIWIPAAREYVETLTNRAIPQQVWEYTLDRFPGRFAHDERPIAWRFGVIRVPRPPLISLDSISYVDPTQATQPFTYTTIAASAVQVNTQKEPGIIAPAPYSVWPATNPLATQAVKFQVTCGYASVSAVPARLKQAVLFVVAHLYENRDAVTEVALQRVPMSVQEFAMAAAPWEYV